MSVKAVGKRKKKRALSATLRNYMWDIGIAAGFLVAFNQEITGETLHEYISLALFAGIIAHVVFHWKWVVQITKRFFTAKLPLKTRINYLLNFGLAGAFFMIGVSGIMISEAIMPMFGLGNGPDIWEELHEVASNLTMLMVIGHVALHWKWIWKNTKKYVLKRVFRPAKA